MIVQNVWGSTFSEKVGCSMDTSVSLDHRLRSMISVPISHQGAVLTSCLMSHEIARGGADPAACFTNVVIDHRCRKGLAQKMRRRLVMLPCCG